MKRALALIFPLLASLVHAGPTQQEQTYLSPFEARVKLATEAETDERFKTYRPAMLRRTGKHLARAMRSCVAASPKTEQKSIVLVADISPAGKATAIEVKPDNEAAKCFAVRFSAISFPHPPAYPERQGFPVVMKIRVAR